MHNSFDFSKIERIEPREDSWSKVCARLDKMEASSKKVLSLRFYSLLPLAASFALVALGFLLAPIHTIDSKNITAQESISQDFANWFKDLGKSETDSYEKFDVFASLDISK